jgi:hypothetical protein
MTICILMVYHKEKSDAMLSSRLSSQYCCKRIKTALSKRVLKHVIGGIFRMNDDSKWLKDCPYCHSRIKIIHINIDRYAYDLIAKTEIQNIGNFDF